MLRTVDLSRFALAAVCGVTLLGSLALPARAQDAARTTARDAAREARRTPVVKAVEKAAPSVVSIGTNQIVRERFWFHETRSRLVPGGLGSGVIVHPRGYVITNLHVINRAHEIFVKLTGAGDEEREIPAKLLAVEPENDLALLRMDEPGPYPSATFGRSDDLMVGETVIAMGNPFGLGRTISTGVVSALNRSIPVNGTKFEGLIQTDAAVNQGNSGGPLLNILGEWIGVNSAIYSMSGGSDGISFAIPVDTARDFLARSLRPRRISGRWLGLEFEGGESGVRTSTVYPVGPAREAKVPEGREVVAVDGRPVPDLVTLRLAVLDALPKGRIALDVKVPATDGTETEPRVERVEIPFAALPTNDLLWRRFGLRCREVTRDVAQTEGYREGAGVMVEKLREDGPAARIGIEEGDLIKGLGPRRVNSLEDLLLVVQFARSETPLDLELGRPQRTARGAVRLVTFNGRIVAD